MYRLNDIRILRILSALFFSGILILIIFKSINDTDYIREKDPYEYAMVGKSIWQGDGLSLEGIPYVIHPPGFSVIAGGFNLLFNHP